MSDDKARIAELEAQLAFLPVTCREWEDMKGRAETAEAAVNELERTNSNLREIVVSLQERANASESRVEGLDETIARLRIENDALRTRARATKSAVRELEARCAAMRKAFEKVWGECTCYHPDLEPLVASALSGDAGRALLERVEELERVVDAAKRLRLAVTLKCCGSDANPKSDCDMEAAMAFDAALDALEPKR